MLDEDDDETGAGGGGCHALIEKWQSKAASDAAEAAAEASTDVRELRMAVAKCASSNLHLQHSLQPGSLSLSLVSLSLVSLSLSSLSLSFIKPTPAALFATRH